MERSIPENPPKTKDSPSSLAGSPRRLLLRHEESLALYAKMHYVRILVGQLRGDKSRKKTAQEELWRGQCGGAYWQGPEGGLTKLPVRQLLKRRNLEYKDFDKEETLFARYKKVEGVQWPASIRRLRNGEKIYEMNSETIEINRNLKDDLFTLSSKTPLLPAAK